jgi:hypothetical protein
LYLAVLFKLAVVGAMDLAVGEEVGLKEGLAEGLAVGEEVGFKEGLAEGLAGTTLTVTV